MHTCVENAYMKPRCSLCFPYKAAGHGMDFVKRLDGEFALALFDFELRQLVLARDWAQGVGDTGTQFPDT